MHIDQILKLRKTRTSDRFRGRKRHTKFTHERKVRFLELFQYHPDIGGQKHSCAEAVGIAAPTLYAHIQRDKAFAEAVESAYEAWVDANLMKPAIQRARDGVIRPIIGGRNKDQVVAEETVYSDTILLALLKAARPEFRGEGDSLTGGGGQKGVMVVPGQPQTATDWSAKYSAMSRPVDHAED